MNKDIVMLAKLAAVFLALVFLNECSRSDAESAEFERSFGQ